MSTKRLIISLKAMKLRAKIACALMLLECKSDMESNTLILCLTLIFCQMSLANSMNITKSLSNTIQKRTSGLSSLLMQLKEEELVLLMISTT